jgi:hypothetical protein
MILQAIPCDDKLDSNLKIYIKTPFTSPNEKWVNKS